MFIYYSGPILTSGKPPFLSSLYLTEANNQVSPANHMDSKRRLTHAKIGQIIVCIQQT